MDLEKKMKLYDVFFVSFCKTKKAKNPFPNHHHTNTKKTK